MRANTKKLNETASQTAGPYVHLGLSPKDAGFHVYDREIGQDIAGPNAQGTRIRVEGTVWDGTGTSVKDVLFEVWQANAAGNFAGQDPVEDGFRGWGRVVSDFDTGVWSFDTIRPGPVGSEAPHLSLWIVARGINIGLNTRIYFPDDEALHAADPVLALVDPLLRPTLIAKRLASDDVPTYRFDITLQGEKETVFFDI